MKKFYPFLSLALAITTMGTGTSYSVLAETPDYPSYISGTTDRKISGATRKAEKVKVESSYVSYSIYDSGSQEIRKSKTIYVNPYLIDPNTAQQLIYSVNGSNAKLIAYFPADNDLSPEQQLGLVNQTLQEEGYSYQAIS